MKERWCDDGALHLQIFSVLRTSGYYSLGGVATNVIGATHLGFDWFDVPKNITGATHLFRWPVQFTNAASCVAAGIFVEKTFPKKSHPSSVGA